MSDTEETTGKSLTKYQINVAVSDLENAIAFHRVAHFFSLHKSSDPKDKMIEELIIKKCERLRDDLFQQSRKTI